MRILLCDDDADTTATCALLLRLDGFEVRTAADGRAALEVARAFLPEAVVLDLALPGMDGYEIARRLKEECAGPAPLVIAVSGYQRRAEGSPFIHFHFLKPVNVEQLAGLLREATVAAG
jgi:DNA-binding response OmpR family regulator